MWKYVRFWALGNNLSMSVGGAVFQQLQQLKIWLQFLKLCSITKFLVNPRTTTMLHSIFAVLAHLSKCSRQVYLFISYRLLLGLFSRVSFKFEEISGIVLTTLIRCVFISELCILWYEKDSVWKWKGFDFRLKIQI